MRREDLEGQVWVEVERKDWDNLVMVLGFDNVLYS